MPVKRSGSAHNGKPKRTRFVSPSPAAESSNSVEGDVDGLLEEDLPEGGVTARSKRDIKDQNGYDSDSSDDEEGVVPSRRPKEKEDDEDVDMFADDVAEDSNAKGKGKGKEKEFMDLEDVEGQEFEKDRGKGKGKGRATADSDSEDDSDVDQKKNKELGFEVTAFNMRAEMEEGRFTADGESYQVNDKDPGEAHDRWLEDVDKEAVKKARRSKREREKVEKEREEKEAVGGEEKKEKERELMASAVGVMQRGETVLEALQRLGKEVEEKRRKEESGKKKTWAERQKERKALIQADAADPNHASNPFILLSNIVSSLTTIGHLDVYSLTRESIQRMLPAPAPTAAATPAPTDTRQFQYRFSLPYVRSLPEAQRPVEREIFGPFSLVQLNTWKSTGFFGSPACENVELRGVEQNQWGSWKDVVGS
ncbi:CD2 antigen cytoplasmic tail-binding protein 2, partial [Tremellales sp. Uapishka_1]